MSEAGEVTVALVAQTTRFDPGCQHARKEIRGIGMDAQAAQKQTAGLLEQVRGAAGRGSAMDEIAKVLSGGGAIMGLHALAGSAASATSKAVELSDALRTGAKSAAQVHEELLQTIPVVGKLVETYNAVNELLTHEKQQARAKDTFDAAMSQAGTDRYAIDKEARAARTATLEHQAHAATEALARQHPESAQSIREQGRIQDEMLKALEEGANRVQAIREKAASASAKPAKELESVKAQLAAAEEDKKEAQRLLDNPISNALGMHEMHEEELNEAEGQIKTLSDRKKALEEAIKGQKDSAGGAEQAIKQSTAAQLKSLQEELVAAAAAPAATASEARQHFEAKAAPNLNGFGGGNYFRPASLTPGMTEAARVQTVRLDSGLEAKVNDIWRAALQSLQTPDTQTASIN